MAGVLALAGSALPAAAQSPMPDYREMAIAQCYATNGRAKRIYDVAHEIDAADKKGGVPDVLWRRYRDLGGKGETPAEAKALSKDPCAELKESLANPPPAAAGKQ
jgi:hypothetical protein